MFILAALNAMRKMDLPQLGSDSRIRKGNFELIVNAATDRFIEIGHKIRSDDHNPGEDFQLFQKDVLNGIFGGFAAVERLQTRRWII